DTAMATDTGMKKNSPSPRDARSSGMLGCLRPVSAVACLVAVGALSTTAISGDWKVTDDIGLTTTAVDRNGNDSYTGVVFQLSPRWTATGRGGRITANVSYQPTLSYGTGSTDPKALTHQLLATSRTEVVRNRFFVGANASAGLRGNQASSGQTDAINFSDGGQQSYSVSVSPEYRQRLSPHINFVSNNNLNHVWYSGNDGGSGSDPSTAYTLNAALQSGRYFGSLGWSLQATQSETLFDDREDDRRRDYTAGLSYRWDAHWQANGSVGYEDADVETNRDDTDGVTWNVGGAWTPNPRTSVNASYGERYYGNTWSGGVSHRSKRTRLGVNASRSLDNRRNQQLVDSFFFLVDEDGNPITDPDTGQPLIANIPQLDDTDEDFINNRVSAIIAVTGLRTTVSLTGTFSRREYEVSDDDQDSYGTTLRATRRLGQGYDASVSSSVTHFTGDGDNDDDSTNYDVSFSLSKQFSRRSSASLFVLYREQNSDDGDDDYDERRIGLTLRTNLL
ncbi:MAG: TIGR03016 family PEP-CTERM system-associated outer membrane protein, partial [Sedimenticolaceae bacterium]